MPISLWATFFDQYSIRYFFHRRLDNDLSYKASEMLSIPYKPSAPLQASRDQDLKRLGIVLLSTDSTTERDAIVICPHDKVEIHTNRILHINPTTPENLKLMQPRLREVVAQILPGEHLDAIYYGCTAASVSIGDESIEASIREARPGVCVVTPALAARKALNVIGAKKISILTPYLRETSEPLVAYLHRDGFEVLNLDYLGLSDDRQMAQVSNQDIIAAAIRAVDDNADALFIACTALHSAEVAEQIETIIKRPVITSNQAGLWMALRSVGIKDKIDGFGQIFKHDLKGGA